MGTELVIEKPSAKKEAAFLRLMAAVGADDTLAVSELAKDRQAFRSIVGMKSYIDSTPLTVAAARGSVRMVRLLAPFLERGDGALDVRDGYGRTAVANAAMNGFWEVANLLVGLGADPGIRDNMNHDALRHAQDFLIRGGAPSAIKDGAGCDRLTPEQQRALRALEATTPVRRAMGRVSEMLSKWQELLSLQRVG